MQDKGAVVCSANLWGLYGGGRGIIWGYRRVIYGVLMWYTPMWEKQLEKDMEMTGKVGSCRGNLTASCHVEAWITANIT